MSSSAPSVDPQARAPHCGNCRFYREPTCRRWAPQATFNNENQSRRAAFQLTWPLVKVADWCGEWESSAPAPVQLPIVPPDATPPNP